MERDLFQISVGRVALWVVLSCLLPMAATAQEGAALGSAGEALGAEEAAETGFLREVVQAPTSRPFNAFERFSYESGIANQLQSLIGRYINPALFNISVQIEGRMLASAAQQNKVDVQGKPSDKVSEEDKVLEMLPALPFFSARLRAPVTVENTEPVREKPAFGGNSLEASGPQIDRIRVVFVVDTALTSSATNFYKNLITSALRLDTRRGDAVLVSQAAFPKFDDNSGAGAQAATQVTVNAQIQSPPPVSAVEMESNYALEQAISKIGSDIALMLGAGLAGLGLLVFLGLVWRGRKSSKEEAMTSTRQSMDMGSANGGAGNGGDGNYDLSSAGGRVQFQTEMSVQNDAQQDELRATDPLMNWLLNERDTLAFVMERLVREQGAKGVNKLVMLLHPYGGDFYNMMMELMESETAGQIEAVWQAWDADNQDPAARQRAMDELKLAMKKQVQFGHFPFIIYLKDKEIYDLLKDVAPLESLMVLEGLAPNRKAVIMHLLGNERTAQILSAYPELADQRYEQYAELSARLFVKLKELRERAVRNEKAYESVLQTIEQQPIGTQAEMVENLKTTNEEMFNYIRERIMLWADVVGLSSDILREGVSGLGSEDVAALLADDEALQAKILPLRPAREQVLIRDLLGQKAFKPQRTEEVRKQLLLTARRLSGGNGQAKEASSVQNVA
ncbi:MAG: hypothetical protein ACK417_07850 [Bacteroidia bacterium]